MSMNRSNRLFVAFSLAAAMSGCATSPQQVTTKLSAPVPVVWVAPVNTSARISVDFTPGLFGMVANAFYMANSVATATAANTRWFVNYFEVVKPVFGDPFCRPKSIFLDYRDALDKLPIGTMVQVVSRSGIDVDFEVVKDAAGSAMSIPPSHVCYGRVMEQAAKQLDREGSGVK